MEELWRENGGIWYHVDVNSAFLSWEAAYRLYIRGEELDLRTVPSVIGGSEKDRHGIVLAKSIPAKAYGIHTGEAVGSARRKCPGLLVIPPDYELYVTCAKGLVKLLEKYCGEIHSYSIDEAFCHMSGYERLYGDPVIFAEELREEIKETLGFSVNIGVSSCKLLAKMASDFKKPDRVHTLFPEEMEQKMWHLPVSDLFYIGGATEKKLKNLGITTIGQLACADRETIYVHLKKQGEFIWNYANGKDVSPFLKELPENKGYGNSMTVPYDMMSEGEVRHVLLALAETVCARMRADGAKAGCVGLTLTDYEFVSASHQVKLPFVTDMTNAVYETVCRLCDSLWNHAPLRKMGVFTDRLSYGEYFQYRLFEEGGLERHGRMDQAVDAIRRRYGEDAVMRASFLNGPIPHMAGGIDRAKRTGMTRGVRMES